MSAEDLTIIKQPPRLLSPAQGPRRRRSLMSFHHWSRLLFFVSLTLIGSCGRSHEEPSSLEFPDGRGLLPHPEGAQSRFRLIAQLEVGASQELPLEALDGWSGYLVSGEREARLTFNAESRASVMLRLGLYGPRDQEGRWGGAPMAMSETGRRLEWSMTLPESGDYFLLPLSASRRSGERLQLSLACEGCGAPSCDSPGLCALVCEGGFARSEEGCSSCSCAEGCAEACPTGSRCASGRCVSDCALQCPPERRPVCGESGRSWPSPCLARCASDPIVREGPCDPPPGTCDEMRPCPPGTRCVDGRCSPERCDCPAGGEPVCSLEREDFENQCLLECRGAELWQTGRCPAESCRSNQDCRAGRYCLPLEGRENREACLLGSSECQRICRELSFTRCDPEHPCGPESVCSGEGERAICLPRCTEETRRCPTGLVCLPEQALCAPRCSPGGRCPRAMSCRRDRSAEDPFCWPSP